jgi:hypothetical protein
MFAIAMILLMLAAIFGALVFITACALLIAPKLRSFGFTVLMGGMVTATIAFALFAFFVLVVEAGREPLLSQVTAVLLAAGFGVGGVMGAGSFVLFRFLRTPNRWADRHRVGHAP